MDTCRALEEEAQNIPEDKGKLWVLPLFSSLPPKEQQLVFEPTPEGSRKVVIATNIAETSITINGVVYVIDLVNARVEQAERVQGNAFTCIPKNRLRRSYW